MSERRDIVLVKIGDISKPADTLIRKVSKAFGAAYAPIHEVRMAKAKAVSSVIAARAKVEVEGIESRAIERFVAEEIQRQSNIESIVQQAAEQLRDDARPDDMSDDWVANFFSKVRDISSQDMQRVWSRLLAGEANSPGSFSRRSVSMLSDFDSRDAAMLSKLRNFCWDINGSLSLVIFSLRDSVYTDNGITSPIIHLLESMGVVIYDNMIKFKKVFDYADGNLGKSEIRAKYCDKELLIDLKGGVLESMPTGRVALTRWGRELLQLCEPSEVPNYYDYVARSWRDYLVSEGSGE